MITKRAFDIGQAWVSGNAWVSGDALVAFDIQFERRKRWMFAGVQYATSAKDALKRFRANSCNYMYFDFKLRARRAS